MKLKFALVAALAVAATTTAAHAQTAVKHIQNEKSPLAAAVWAGDTLYCSGQIADPLTPADPAKNSAAVFGDTQEQTFSILTKIQALLKSQGLEMKDVVKMTVFLAADPAKGNKLDFPGLQASFTKFFGTKEQPNKPARSAVQVAALVLPGALAEIEVIAVKSK
ncbi:MAG: RidA family protein [Acidobacteriaceae bacterium]|nr:RidA family protein [Acidobacteriaceae bacterium]